jgi:hypothetical protein
MGIDFLLEGAAVESSSTFPISGQAFQVKA